MRLIFYNSEDSLFKLICAYSVLQQQYSFIYIAVLEALLSGDTTITNSAFSEAYEDLCTLKPDTSSTPLEDQFEVSHIKVSKILD